jgi:hypothetical protein
MPSLVAGRALLELVHRIALTQARSRPNAIVYFERRADQANAQCSHPLPQTHMLLPLNEEVSARNKVATGTLSRAIGLLKEAGLVHVVRGKGPRVIATDARVTGPLARHRPSPVLEDRLRHLRNISNRRPADV